MVFFFRDKSIVNIFFLLLLTFAVHFHLFYAAPLVLTVSNDGLISPILQKLLSNLPATILVFIYLFLLFIQALKLNATLNNLKMFQQQNYTVAMSYILFSGFFAQWSNISAALVANFFVIWIFSLLAKLYNLSSPKSWLFNIGILTAITILGYHPTSILVGITIFAVMIVRPFKIAEWFILLIGILMPFYFLGSYLFLFDQWHLFVNFLPSFQFHLPIQIINLSIGLAISILFVCLLFGIFYNQANSSRNVIQIRKNWGVMMLLLLLMLPVSFVFRGTNLNTAILCLVPSAAFAANAYSYPKRLIIPNILFWLTVALLVYNNWILIKN